MKKSVVLLLGAICVCFASNAYPQDNNLAKTNMAHEHAICSAYSLVASECLKGDPRSPGLDGKYLEMAELFFVMSTYLSDSDVAKARIELEASAMAKEMRDCSRVSVLLNKHMNKCEELLKGMP